MILAALAMGAFAANAADAPLWLRETAVNADGSSIAFTYKGDIYTVPVAGGRAKQITATNGVLERNPVFSPNGKQIAYNCDREGSYDVFVVNAQGGTPVRLTTHSANETVLGWLNDSTVLFAAGYMPSDVDLNAPFFGQVLAVSTTPGSRPRLLESLSVSALDVNAAGDIILQTKKSYENNFRKHEHSAGTPDIYLLRGGQYTKLGRGEGSFRTPVWLDNDGKKYAYTADGQGGVLNVYSAEIGQSTAKQLTNYTDHPVRNLSASRNGLMAYSYDGEIYTLRPGESPRKVNVQIVADEYNSDFVKRYVTGGASNMTVAKSGQEVAFILRGELYVTNVKYKTTKRITNTAGQERCMSFSPDGRSLVYDAERDGLWKLYIAKLSKPSEDNFAYATEIEEELLYSSDKTAQQPVFSPDGKKIAFLEDRATLRVLDVETHQVVTALDGRFNYSYSDGDIAFEWSPDSKWLLADYIGIGGWNSKDVALIKADGSEVIDLTESGYDDADPHWVLGGKAFTYTTGRYGMRSHGSWGNQSDVVFMALDPEAWDMIHMTEEEAELAEKTKKAADDDDADDNSSKKKKKKNKKEKETVAAEPEQSFDLRNRHHRKMRLTDVSASMGGHFLSPKGDKLYYIAYSPDGESNLYAKDLREGNTEVLASGISGGFEPDSAGENLFFISGSGLKKLELASGTSKAIEFSAQYDRQPSQERDYIYTHALRQVKDKFYDPELHGVPWDSVCNHYRKFLPYVTNNQDFAILLSEVLGELNASHTGASAATRAAGQATATLAAYYDTDYQGDGLRIKTILPRSPLEAKKAGVQPGDIIMAIDGEQIIAGKDYYPLLDGKAGRNTILTIKKADGSTKDITIKPLASEGDLRYQAWVERNEALVDSLSNGRIGYVHIEGMDSPSFRQTYERLLGKYRNCEAVVVDTRFNGGGFLHNDVAVLLSGKEYARFAPRGQYIGSEPFAQWYKPSVMLVNEANYSDAHGTPYAYQALEIGDIVGAPVPGTMTAVWWETQIDPEIVFGIPEVTVLDKTGKPLENKQLQPEVEVYNTPAETTTGHDLQLETAVRHLLQTLEK